MGRSAFSLYKTHLPPSFFLNLQNQPDPPMILTNRHQGITRQTQRLTEIVANNWTLTRSSVGDPCATIGMQQPGKQKGSPIRALKERWVWNNQRSSMRFFYSCDFRLSLDASTQYSDSLLVFRMLHLCTKEQSRCRADISRPSCTLEVVSLNRRPNCWNERA